MAKMQAVRSEESFVLASLKEFVKTWGTGRDGSFQLVCKDGQTKLSMEFSLEAPGSLHFTPSEDNQNSSNREKRRKTPSTLRRDKSVVRDTVLREDQGRPQELAAVPQLLCVVDLLQDLPLRRGEDRG
jgi:hypothetical protein